MQNGALRNLQKRKRTTVSELALVNSIIARDSWYVGGRWEVQTPALRSYGKSLRRDAIGLEGILQLSVVSNSHSGDYACCCDSDYEDNQPQYSRSLVQGGNQATRG